LPASKADGLPLADPRALCVPIKLIEECPAGVGPACPVWKTGAFAARPRALFEFISSCGGRNRTCDRAVNSRPPVPTRAPPQWHFSFAPMARMASLSPQWRKLHSVLASRTESRRGRIRTDDLVLPTHADFQTFPHADHEAQATPSPKEPHRPKKHPAGVEPARPPWRGGRPPLHHECIGNRIRLSKSKSTG
jgi:hypothetical protein